MNKLTKNNVKPTRLDEICRAHPERHLDLVKAVLQLIDSVVDKHRGVLPILIKLEFKVRWVKKRLQRLPERVEAYDSIIAKEILDKTKEVDGLRIDSILEAESVTPEGLSMVRAMAEPLGVLAHIIAMARMVGVKIDWLMTTSTFRNLKRAVYGMTITRTGRVEREEIAAFEAGGWYTT